MNFKFLQILEDTNKTEIANSLINASNIIVELGKLKLKDGSTLKESISIKGISFWTIVETDLALHVLPKLLFSKPSFFNYKNKLFLFLRYTKYKLFNLYNLFFFNFKNLEKENNKSIWFILGFTNYIYRDTLKPIFDLIKNKEDKIQPIKINNTLIKKIKCNSSKIKLFKEYINLNLEIKKSKTYLQNNGILELGKKQTIVSEEEFLFIIYWIYNISISKLKFDILITERDIKYFEPEIIISGDMADSRNRLYTLFAKKLSIPTLDLQFGAYDESSIEWRFFISDKVAVWGEYFSKIFINQMNIPSHKIEITGSSRFDYLNKINTLISNSDFVSKKPKVVLFASMYTQISSYDARYDISLIDKFKLDLVEIFKINKNLQLLIKLHPLEDRTWIPNLKNFDNIHVIDSNQDIRNYISGSDIFVTYGSTATFDALLLNKIIISANYPGLVWWDDIFLKEGVTIPVNNVEELTFYLCNNYDNYNTINRKILIQKTKFIEKFLTDNIVDSSQRIVNLAKTIIFNNNSLC